MNPNLCLLQSTTELNNICSVAAGSSFWAVSNAVLVFVYVFSVVLICSLEGYLMCLVSVIQLLPFWHVPLLTCHLVGLNAGYHGGGGTSAPCSTGIAWAGRGISKAVAWHAPRVLPLWWCPNGVPGLMLATMVKVGYALRVPLALHGLALLYLKR